MPADPRIAPSDARLRRAWRAGLRARPRWLLFGALALLASAVLGGMTASGIADALQLGTWTPAPDPEAALSRLLVGSLGLAAAVLAVLVIVRLVTGTLGGVSSDGGRGDLPRQPAALGPTTTVVLGLVTLVAVAVALRGTIAAAARAVASSESGLHTLWMQTAADGLAATGSILLVAGLVEWVLLRRAQRRALWLDEAQARAERRASGSGRR